MNSDSTLLDLFIKKIVKYRRKVRVCIFNKNLTQDILTYLGKTDIKEKKNCFAEYRLCDSALFILLQFFDTSKTQ